jgi:hypothetical protein
VTGAGLSAITEQDLVALVAVLDRGDVGVPMNETSLQANGFGHLVEALGPYLGLGPLGVRAIVDVVLAERAHRKAPRLTLVWTGDDPGLSHSRHTRVVLPELFAQAREHVLVAGYSIDHGEELFASLYRGMAEQGVTADFFVDVDQLAERLRQAVRAARRGLTIGRLPRDFQWAQQGLNLRLHPCEGCTLPLSYAPWRSDRLTTAAARLSQDTKRNDPLAWLASGPSRRRAD